VTFRSGTILWLALTGCAAPSPRPESARPVSQAAPAVRRLTVAQYRNTLTDLLGPGLVFPMLDEEPGTGGFSTTGAAQVTTSFHGVEQYVSAAEIISRQLFNDEAHVRGTGNACKVPLTLARTTGAQIPVFGHAEGKLTEGLAALER
jgi:hypothetical protein